MSIGHQGPDDLVILLVRPDEEDPGSWVWEWNVQAIDPEWTYCFDLGKDDEVAPTEEEAITRAEAWYDRFLFGQAHMQIIEEGMERARLR
jgi:hypothetical protein